LYSGGGDAVAHSSVHASQGSSPAGAPLRSDRTMFQIRHAMAAAWKMTPIEASRFRLSQPRPAA